MKFRVVLSTFARETQGVLVGFHVQQGDTRRQQGEEMRKGVCVCVGGAFHLDKNVRTDQQKLLGGMRMVCKNKLDCIQY